MLNEKIDLSNVYIKLGKVSYIQTNKNIDPNKPEIPRKRKKSYSDEELDESNNNIVEDNFVGYLKDSTGKSNNEEKTKNLESNKKIELLNYYNNKNKNIIILKYNSITLI